MARMRQINSYYSQCICMVKKIKKGFNDISILNDKKGKPYFLFNKKIKKILKNKYKLNRFKTHLSLSDEKKHSVSYVILQKIK